VTPGSAGTFSIGVANALGLQTTKGLLSVAAADPYVPSQAMHSGNIDTWLHDPVRQAIFALDRQGNAFYKYQYDGRGGWNVSAVAVQTPLDIGLSPDGARLFITTGGALREYDPTSLALRATYSLSANQGLREPLASSVDGKLWIPSGYYSGATGIAYFDLLSNALGSQAIPYGASAGAFKASADGATVLESPNFEVSRQSWFVYKQATQSITALPYGVSFGYDPHMSTDGSRILDVGPGGSAPLFDGAFNRLGQLPANVSNEAYGAQTISPDGTRIVAVVDSFTSQWSSNLTGVRIDIFDSTKYSPGTTDFVKIASIPMTTNPGCSDVLACNVSGYLLVSLDGKTIFSLGNQALQVFKMPQ